MKYEIHKLCKIKEWTKKSQKGGKRVNIDKPTSKKNMRTWEIIDY